MSQKERFHKTTLSVIVIAESRAILRLHCCLVRAIVCHVNRSKLVSSLARLSDTRFFPMKNEMPTKRKRPRNDERRSRR